MCAAASFADITSARGMTTEKTLAVHGLAALSAAELEPRLADFSSGNVVDLLLATASGCPKMAWVETGFQSCVLNIRAH